MANRILCGGDLCTYQVIAPPTPGRAKVGDLEGDLIELYAPGARHLTL